MKNSQSILIVLIVLAIVITGFTLINGELEVYKADYERDLINKIQEFQEVGVFEPEQSPGHINNVEISLEDQTIDPEEQDSRPEVGGDQEGVDDEIPSESTPSPTTDLVSQVKRYLAGQNLSSKEKDLRIEIIERAEIWVREKVPYGSFDDYHENDYFEGYRTDCSGFISYSWHLTKNWEKISANTVELKLLAERIDFKDLLPGDIINNGVGGRRAHVVLFVSWLDDEQTKFLAVHLSKRNRTTARNVLNLDKMDGEGYTIREYQVSAPGPYFAQQSPDIP